jgi:DNA-directed RNA polymerase subunit alpha
MGVFVMPKKLRVEKVKEEADHYYAKFILSPLEKGYAITIGNALRRVLLSSIPSLAITSMRFIKPEKYHEYDTVEGVREDILEMILNLKEVQFKTLVPVDGEVKMVVEKKGPGVLKAGDIKTPSGIEVANPEHVIAHLNEDADILFEIYAEVGKGYEPASEREEKPEIGWILIDGIFSPVLKVNFYQENVRVGKRTDYDKLILEVWTKKSIKPEEALRKAVEILIDHFNIILNSLPEAELLEIEKREVEEHENIEEEKSLEEEVYGIKIEELGLSKKIVNALKREKIETVGDLLKKGEEELLKIKHFGPKSLEDLRKLLKEKLGVDLRKEGTENEA